MNLLVVQKKGNTLTYVQKYREFVCIFFGSGDLSHVISSDLPVSNFILLSLAVKSFQLHSRVLLKCLLK